ncbi:MAG: flagellar filament capping protein FliD, partial [Methylococcales bacterium]|nr:flagellar filament capping protein FliD [Methylococcales bacterium]
VVTVSGSSIANPGNYTLEVTNLAQAHSLSSKSFTETSSPVGTGTLSFEFGHFDTDSNSFISNSDKASKTITIDSDDNSLQGIRDAVNAADIGVTASLVNDGSGFKLLFTSDETGKENGVKISVSDTSDASNTDDSGLSQLAFDPDPAAAADSHMTENMAAIDAAFTLNGLSITSASNNVSSAVSGMTINLKGTTTPGSPVNVSIAKNDAKITEAVTGFTEKFNELVDTLKQLSSYDSANNQAGPLLGDSAVRSVESQLRKMISSSSRGADGNISSLASIGVTTDRSGKLSLDSNKFQSALTDNRDVIAQIFSASGTSSDSQVNFITSNKNTQTGQYNVNLDVMASRGVLSGTAAPALADLATTPLTIDNTNDSFSLFIDGIGTGNISLTQKAYSSGAELATEIQAKINASDSLKNNGSSVLVSFADGKLQITSALYGDKSSVEITGIEGANDLGLAIGEGTSGTDVKGTIGSQEADSLGTILTGRGDAEGMILEFSGGSAGNRGSVFFNRGIADQLDSLISNFLKSDSLIDSRTTGLNTRIDRLNEQRTELNEKMDTLEARLFKQFNAMDQIVAQLQSTGTYLEQQLANLPGVVRESK